jgi:hypothetical protein
MAKTGKKTKKKTEVKKAAVNPADTQFDVPDNEYLEKISEATRLIFNSFDSQEVIPQDYQTPVPIDSIEASVGYGGLIRQMHDAFVKRVAYHKSALGGGLSSEEARAKAFHACGNAEEAIKVFNTMLQLPVSALNFVDLLKLYDYAPRVAERFWERVKLEGRAEFESGHLAANVNFPVSHLRTVWNVARFLGVRQSYIDDWQPKGAIELGLLDMLVQTYFQWQFWLEQAIKRSQTPEREEAPQYTQWKEKHQEECERAFGYRLEGNWFRPYVSEEQAINHASQMADRWNKAYMRTLRQLTNLRRLSPVIINNPNQVNLATDGGQQVNVANEPEDKKVLDFRQRQTVSGR